MKLLTRVVMYQGIFNVIVKLSARKSRQLFYNTFNVLSGLDPEGIVT